MKTMLIVVCGLAVLVGWAPPVQAESLLESQTSLRLERASSLSSKESTLSEILAGGLSYSGIAVEVVKTDNLLQLFNPLAPAKYGSVESNTLRDLDTGRASGLKLFSIDF
jgi:hypothetical protein